MDSLTVFGAWWKLLCIAGGSPIRGSLYVTVVKRYSNDDVAAMLRISNEQCSALVSAFIDLDMLDTDKDGAYHIKNWDKRQFDSDNSTNRVRKYRKNKKETDEKRFSNVSVTPPDTDIESDTDTDTDTEGEENAADNSLIGDLGDIQAAFLTASKLPMYGIDDKAIGAYQELKAMGAKPADIADVVEKLRAKKYTITGPWSIINSVKIHLSEAAQPRRPPIDPEAARLELARASIYGREI